MIEQDQRRIKHRTGPMLEPKRFGTPAVMLSGVEIVEKIKKQQFRIGKLPGKPKTMPRFLAAVLAA